MLQKIIGQFTRDERLYDDEKIKKLASRFPPENSPDGQRMIMYMLLFSWYTRNTVLPFTADQIVSLVDSIIDVYYNQEYQQMNNIMISLLRNDLQRMSFWSNEYVFKTFFNDDFITDADGRMYVNLEKLSVFNKWILQNAQNVEFYNYSHLLVQKCNANNKKLQYVHNYTIMVSDDVPQNVVQTHCPKCDVISQTSKDDFLKMCRNYEKSYAKFSQGISIYCHKCNTQINFIRLYGNFKVLYGGVGNDSYFEYNEDDQEQEQYEKQEEQEQEELSVDVGINCDKVVNNEILQKNINTRQTKINNGEQAKWNSLQSTFEQFGAIVQNTRQVDWSYQQAQKWYKKYMDDVSNNIPPPSRYEYFILNLQQVQGNVQNNGAQNDPGLNEIFKYFAKQQAEHMDMVYYSGQAFTQKIEYEVEKLSSIRDGNLSKDVIEELKNLWDCLNYVYRLLNQPPRNKLTLKSDGINGDKLGDSNYKLFKLYIKDYFVTQNNDYYKTVYFVSNLEQKTEIKSSTFTIMRKQIEYISLCHGGIVIKIDNGYASRILDDMLYAIDYLLRRQYKRKPHYYMKRLIIFIAIMSKYQKAAYQNVNASKSTLRDDYNCIMDNKNDKHGQSHSFYKTFMSLYYAMLLWDGTDDNPIKVDTFNNNVNIIEILRKTFIAFYKKLKYNGNNDDNNKLIFDTQNGAGGTLIKDKQLSFLMTLYTYDCYIKKIFSHVYNIPKERSQQRQMCYCLIKWIRNFVLYMLVNVYGYKEENLKNVRKSFQDAGIIEKSQICLLDEVQFENLKNRPQQNNFHRD